MQAGMIDGVYIVKGTKKASASSFAEADAFFIFSM